MHRFCNTRIACTIALEVSPNFLQSTSTEAQAAYWLSLPSPLHQHFYVTTSCQLRRMEAASRSPIYSLISETFQGSSVIRAHKDQQRFISKSNFLVDENQRICFPGAVADRYKICPAAPRAFCKIILCWEKRRGHPATALCSLLLQVACYKPGVPGQWHRAVCSSVCSHGQDTAQSRNCWLLPFLCSPGNPVWKKYHVCLHQKQLRFNSYYELFLCLLDAFSYQILLSLLKSRARGPLGDAPHKHTCGPSSSSCTWT